MNSFILKEKTDFMNYILIIFVYVFTHFLLILNDGLYFDDSHLVWMLKSKDWDMLYIAQSMYGNTLIAYFDWLFSYFPNTAFYMRLTVFASSFISSILLYKVCLNSGFVNRGDSLFISLLYIVFPAYLMNFVINITFHSVSNLFFIGGVYLSIKLENSEGRKNIIFRLSSLVLFLLSFITNSYLVFYFGFLIFYLIYKHKKSSKDILSDSFTFLTSRIDFILLPFVFWASKLIFTPVWGWALGYNKITLNIADIFFVYARFVRTFVWQIYVLGSSHIRFVVVMLVSALVLSFVLPYTQKVKRRDYLFIVVFSIVLLILAIFPYAAVNKSLGNGLPTSYDSRNALLVAIPIAILLVSMARMIFQGKVILMYSILVILIVNCCLYRVNVYALWQIDAVKQNSILLNMKDNRHVRDLHVVVLDVYYATEIDDKLSWPSSFLGIIFGELSRYCFVSKELKVYKEKDMKWEGFYNNVYPKKFNKYGTQGIVKVLKRHNFDNMTLLKKYFYSKYFEPNNYEQFTKSLSSLEVIEYYPTD
jgi:hypothetical protein